MKKSCQQILDSFEHFACEVAENTCTTCRRLLRDTSIDQIHENIQKNFEGLCLDCMDFSSGSAQETKNYLRRDLGEQYDDGCRISHGQPTWYWSYMGRRTEMQAHQREKHKQWDTERVRFRRLTRRNTFH
jgi:hypothetical protein